MATDKSSAAAKAVEKHTPETPSNKTVVFLHPDLGIGGAERLVIDAAVGLQKRGHKVVIFTGHCDPKHCFDEARDGTLDVRVRGNLLPTSFLGRFAILLAILRQFHLLLSITILTTELSQLKPTILFVDQLSACLPFLKWLTSKPVFFYCHFPDKLLAQGRDSWLKRLYRGPFDVLEEYSMEWADAVAVNSEFTRGVLGREWPMLLEKGDVRVVYPSISIEEITKQGKKVEEAVALWKDKRMLLSVNRFERKKDVALAIKAFAALDKGRRKDARLVIAGGYDPRVPENAQYHTELETLATTLNLTHATAKTLSTALAIPQDTEVLFFLSAPNAAKVALLHSALLLLYTPSNEHFGIVPLEAMRAGTPVLAADNGGPTETVVDGETGFLRDPIDIDAWTDVIDKVLNKMSDAELKRMGEAGKRRVREKFAEETMAERLDGIFDQLVERHKAKNGDGESEPIDWPLMLFAIGFVAVSTAFMVGIQLW